MAKFIKTSDVKYTYSNYLLAKLQIDYFRNYHTIAAGRIFF